MTQESIISNHVDDVSPSGSAYSSGEIYRMTLEENGDLFMENNGDLRGIANGDVLDRVDSGSLIINSPGTHLGTKVMIKVDGPTTFVTGGNKCLENGEFANGCRLSTSQKNVVVFLLLAATLMMLAFLGSPSKTSNISIKSQVLKLNESKFIDRTTWNASKPKGELDEFSLEIIPDIIFISQTGGKFCGTMCVEEVKNIQQIDMQKHNDIHYNFLIGGDGRIYEGLGWSKTLYSQYSHGIVYIGVIGEFSKNNFSAEMFNALWDLIDQGIKSSHLSLNDLCIMALINRTGKNLLDALNGFQKLTNNCICKIDPSGYSDSCSGLSVDVKVSLEET